MSEISNHVERMVRWLHAARDAGKPCPGNIVQSIIAEIGCTRPVARAVKLELVRSKRLVHNPIKRIFRIEGKDFNVGVPPPSEIDVVKTVLRRRYAPVYDPRTVDIPGSVAAGRPRELIIGSYRIPYSDAVMIAKTDPSWPARKHA